MILSGKDLAKKMRIDLKERIAKLPSAPGLAVILVGDHPSSATYVAHKKRACQEVGIRSYLHKLPAHTPQEALLSLIDSLNSDRAVHGILLQLPLPEHLSAPEVIEAIDPAKDVDGFHPINMGRLLIGLPGGFVPCTPLGILSLLKNYDCEVSGKDVVIVGRSSIVGKPLAALLLQKHATVTVVHSRTTNLKAHTRRADILVAAVGIPHFIKEEMVQTGAVVIDVGITRREGRLIGDVDFEPVEKKCRAITPVPGGVGPMTVAMLLENTYLSYQRFSS